VHSKVIVIDPFTPDCVVMTGSHNLGTKASKENDENFIIIQNNASLAESYAVNILSVYDMYRWRYKLSQGKKFDGWKGLQDSDNWQDSYLDLNGEKNKELNFLMNDEN